MIKKADKQDRRRISDRTTQGITAALSLAAMLLLCFCLYRYDNQYTSGCPQPVNGVLDLREADLNDKGRPYHIQKDWDFYPDVLLKPGDDFSLYLHHLISVGKSSKELRHEKGTYRLTLLLPDTPMNYVLKLPVTFSAYRVYANDELLLSVGLPGGEEGGSRELAKDQLVTFRASGEVRLLIHYLDDAGIYPGLSGLSGLGAPPSLGRPLRIFTMAETHRTFLFASVVLILLTLVLSLTLFRSWQQSNLAVIALCISSIAYLAYPLISSIRIFPAYPWYHLEMLSYFSCHAAAHWIYCLHYGWNDRPARFVKWYSVAAVGICAAALGAFPLFPDGVGWALFYECTRALQWGAILCGMALTLRLVVSGAPGKLMCAASVAIWVFLLVELTAPNFSPVVSARFPVMGIIVLMDISILVEYADVAAAHRFRLLYAQKIAHTETLLKLEERHYVQLSDQVEDARRIRHDLRQHLRVIRTLLDRGDAQALSAYLEQYTKNVQPLLTKPLTFFQVPMADALMAYYWSAAQKRGAEVQVSGQLRELPQEVYVDFCSIMGNLLENALEALDRQEPDEPKWIHVRCDIVRQKLLLEVVNSNSSPVRKEKSRFHSSKRDELGMGTLSISMIAQQYGGGVSFSPEGDHFVSRVLLPLSGLRQQSTSPAETDD